MREEKLRYFVTCDSIALSWKNMNMAEKTRYSISCSDMQKVRTDMSNVTFSGLLPDFTYQIVFQVLDKYGEIAATECLSVRTKAREQMLRLVV